MPAIYIQLAGASAHSLHFSSAQPAQAATATVARAACHNCGHVCFDLQRTLRANAPKCQGWPRCCVGAARDVAARRAHDAALNCRIVCLCLCRAGGRLPEIGYFLFD